MPSARQILNLPEGCFHYHFSQLTRLQKQTVNPGWPYLCKFPNKRIAIFIVSLLKTEEVKASKYKGMWYYNYHIVFIAVRLKIVSFFKICNYTKITSHTSYRSCSWPRRRCAQTEPDWTLYKQTIHVSLLCYLSDPEFFNLSLPFRIFAFWKSYFVEVPHLILIFLFSLYWINHSFLAGT